MSFGQKGRAGPSQRHQVAYPQLLWVVRAASVCVVIEVTPVESNGGIGNDQRLGPQSMTTFIGGIQEVPETASGPVESGEADNFSDACARLKESPSDAELAQSPAKPLTRGVHEIGEITI